MSSPPYNIEVSGVPIVITDAQDPKTTLTSDTTSQDKPHTPQNKVIDFYRNYVVNSLGIMKVAHSFEDLKPVLIERIKEFTCKPMM